MARYNLLDDGSSVIETDDGRQVRTALPSERLEADFGATLDPELQLTARANDITKRIDDVRAKYDPNYASARDEQKRKAADAAGRQEIDDKAGKLKGIIDEQRSRDLSGATAQNSLVKPLAPGEQRAPLSLSDAGGAPLQIATPEQVAAAPSVPRVRLAPDTSGAQGAPSMGSYAASQGPGGQGPDPVLSGLADLAASQAIRRSGPSRGGWVPTSRSVTRENIPPPEALAEVDAAERGVESVAQDNAEAAAQRFNETVVTPQLDQLEQNTAALAAAYERRKRYDDELAARKKDADDTEREAAEMKMPNVRDDYFENNGGIFGRLLAGIAAGAGQWASMAKGGGGPNNALAIINDSIKEHGQNLRDKYEQAKDNAKAKQNAYGQALAQYGDPETAQEALNLRGETIADRMIKVQMGRHLNAGENAALDQWLAQRKVDRAARWADAAGKAAGRTVESESYAQPRGASQSVDLKALGLAVDAREKALKAGGGGESEPWKQDLAARQLAIRLSPEDAKRLGTPQLFATDPEQKKEARKALDYFERGDRAIRRLEEISRTSGWEVNPDLQTEVSALKGIVRSQLSNPLGLLQQTKEELRELSGPLSEVSTWRLDSQAQRSLKTSRELFQQNKDLFMRGLTRSPFKYDFAEGDVDQRPVRGAK
jgi:hypothetical protein